MWWFSQSHRLPADVRALIADPAAPVFVSLASFWEAAIKRAKGRLAFDDAALVKVVGDSGLKQLSITIEHALAASVLPRHHDDPFDRMLVAQALTEGLTVISSDSQFHLYDVGLLAV